MKITRRITNSDIESITEDFDRQVRIEKVRREKEFAAKVQKREEARLIREALGKPPRRKKVKKSKHRPVDGAHFSKRDFEDMDVNAMLRVQEEKPWAILKIRQYQVPHIGDQIKDYMKQLLDQPNPPLIVQDDYTSRFGNDYLRFRIFDPSEIRPLTPYLRYSGVFLTDSKKRPIFMSHRGFQTLAKVA